MSDQLRGHAERTATGAAKLLKGAKDKPRGLTSGTVTTWLHGVVESVKPSSFAYVLARWASLPTHRRMPLTPEMSATLQAEMARTGLGPVTLLRRAPNCPPELTRQVVNGWAARTVNTVSVEHWEYVMARLRRLPEAAAPARSHLVQRRVRQTISEDDLAELRRHRERTGIGGDVLLRSAIDKPPGLTAASISNWLSHRSKAADPAHIAYVLARYRAMP